MKKINIIVLLVTVFFDRYVYVQGEGRREEHVEREHDHSGYAADAGERRHQQEK